MTTHADRDRSEPYWPPTAAAAYDQTVPYVPTERDDRVQRYADLIGRLYLTTSDGGCHTIEDIARAVVALADTEQQAVASENERLCLDVERLTAERDRAREECGHEKATRASQREEMMRYFVDMQTAQATVARVRSVCRTTDGDWLDGDAEIPVGEVVRMLYPDGVAL